MSAATALPDLRPVAENDDESQFATAVRAYARLVHAACIFAREAEPALNIRRSNRSASSDGVRLRSTAERCMAAGDPGFCGAATQRILIA